MKQRVVLIGPGRVGAAIGKRLYEAGYPLTAVISRQQQNAEEAVRFIGCDSATATTNLAEAGRGEIILLAVPDDQIGLIADRLHQNVILQDKATLVHFSGLHPASILATAGMHCVAVSIHPLLSFADREIAADHLTGCPCALEGEEKGVAVAEELVTAMGSRAFRLPSEAKALYHAAACMASNYLVTLTACARDLLTQCGFDQQQALELLTPIHRATSDNLVALGPENALTGPVVRGDIGTIDRHLAALKEKVPGLLELYRCLGQHTVELSTASGRLKEAQAVKLQQVLATRGTSESNQD